MENDKENVCEMDTQTEQGSVQENQELVEKKEGLADLGKFKDVSALMQAYQSLQAEFTRRSQRLKRYEESENQECESRHLAEKHSEQNRADASRLELAGPDSTEREGVKTADGNAGVGQACEASDGEKTMATNGDGTNSPMLGLAGNSEPSLYEQVIANEEVRLKIVGDYLSSLGRSGAPLMKGGGGVLTSPAKKPASIADAGKMALAYLQGQKQQA